MTFWGGSRACIGFKFAEMEMSERPRFILASFVIQT